MKASDTSGLPGDLVMLRGKLPQSIWSGVDPMVEQRIGVAMPGSIGVLVTPPRAHTWVARVGGGFRNYVSLVLWSCPCVVGWIDDGLLRRV